MRVFLAAVLVGFIYRAQAYSPAATCAIAKSGTFIADPEDCSSYYYCMDGAVDYHGTCANGWLYDSYNARCDYPDKVTCRFGNDICKNKKRQEYLSDPTNCEGYIFCDGKGNTQKGTCPKGQIFDLTTISCVWAPPGSCSGSPCDLVANNNFVASGVRQEPNQKKQYGALTCYNGIGTQNWCNEDFVYSAPDAKCIYKPEATEEPNCIAGTQNGPVAVPRTGSAAPGTDLFAASPTNCNHYYWCPPAADGVTPPPVLLKCPSRFHFNALTGSCVYSWTYRPTGANVNCNRCGGYTSGWFVTNANNRDCSQYIYCGANGSVETKFGVGKCLNLSFPFFDESTQNCIGTRPTGFCATQS